MVAYVRTLLGASWDPVRKRWSIPEEFQPAVHTEALRQGVSISWEWNLPSVSIDPELVDKRLHPFQAHIVERIGRERRLIVAAETGLGKGVVALAACKALAASRVLIVTMKGIRGHWENEIATWDAARNYQLTHYEQLAEFVGQQYDIIVFDEVHNLKNWKTARYSDCVELLKGHTDKHVIALSATPVDKPEEIHSLVNLLWPKRFGYWLSYGEKLGFRDTYCITETTDINGREVTRVKGIKEAQCAALRARVAALSVHVSKLAHSNLLPPFKVSHARLPAVNSPSPEQLGGEDQFAAKAESPLLADSKVDHIVEWVAARSEQRVAVITYHVEFAKRLAGLLSADGRQVILITGETTKRDSQLLAAKSGDNTVLVASMKSVGTGINLTAFSEVIVTELTWSINQMKQLFGRFHRLSGSEPVNLTLLTVKNTLADLMAYRLAKKISAVSQLMGTGQTDVDMMNALGEESQTDEEFKSELRAAFASYSADSLD